MHLVLGFPTRLIGEFGIPTTFVNRLDVILIHISLLLVYTTYTNVTSILLRFLNKYLFYFLSALKKYKVGWSLPGLWWCATYNYCRYCFAYFILYVKSQENVSLSRLYF
jgi:hypothetical protein